MASSTAKGDEKSGKNNHDQRDVRAGELCQIPFSSNLLSNTNK